MSFNFEKLARKFPERASPLLVLPYHHYILMLCFPPALHLTPRLLNIAISRRRENINFSSFAFIHYVRSS